MSLIDRIWRWRRIGRLRRSERGIAATEFALTMPIWMTLLLGCADGTYCLLVNERVDRISFTVANIVTQQQLVTKAGLDTIMLAGAQMMQPFTFGTNGVVIVSSVYKPPGLSPIIEWQYTGGGSLGRTSKIGRPGGLPTLPAGLTLNDNDNVITSEVYYVFNPMFVNFGVVSGGDVYRASVFKPRLSQLTIPPV